MQTRSICELESFEWSPDSPSMRRLLTPPWLPHAGELGRPLLAPPGWTPPLTHTIGPKQPSRSQKLVGVPSSVFPHSTTCYTSDRPCDLPRQPLPQPPFSTAIHSSIDHHLNADRAQVSDPRQQYKTPLSENPRRSNLTQNLQATSWH